MEELGNPAEHTAINTAAKPSNSTSRSSHAIRIRNAPTDVLRRTRSMAARRWAIAGALSSACLCGPGSTIVSPEIGLPYFCRMRAVERSSSPVVRGRRQGPSQLSTSLEALREKRKPVRTPGTHRSAAHPQTKWSLHHQQSSLR